MKEHFIKWLIKRFLPSHTLIETVDYESIKNLIKGKGFHVSKDPKRPKVEKVEVAL